MLLGRSCALALASLTLLVVSPAQADVPRRRGPCDKLEVGAACEERGVTGTCVDSTCPRRVYNDGKRKTVRVPCRKCEAAPEETPPAEANAEDGGAPPETEDKGPAQDNTAAKADVEIIAAGEASTPTPEPERKGLCAVDPSRSGPPLLFVLGLAFVGRRRRRRR